MSNLINMFKQEAKKAKNESLAQESRTAFGFTTGLDLLDFKNGKAVFPVESKPYLSLGVVEGTYVMWVGASGSGKSTIALQSAFNIIKPYEQGSVFHFDIENATDKSRVKKITGWDMEDINKKYFHKNTGISSESFYQTIKLLHEIKTGAERETFLSKTGKLDESGNEIEILAPTVIILDSLPMLVPQNIANEEELSGQMSQTSVARVNASVFRRILPLLKEANLILYVINHITTKVEINPMMHSKPQVNFLKQGEELPGKLM